MKFSPGVWLVMCNTIALVEGYCLYGDETSCAFQCHCAVKSECSGGTCSSGCDAAPLGYNWAGPACQIGNVGLHKSANMTAQPDYNSHYPPTGALDGINPGAVASSCAHPAAEPKNPAEWWADLGDLYKIYNITIYGRTDCCAERLQQFDLTVYNTSDNEILCGYHHDPILTQSTITCTTPVIGRYVHFIRKGGPDIQVTALCEVVIIGHKYIDCSHCPNGISCNDVTGCEACDGFYQPDCKQRCDAGFYGINCKEQCGRCKDGTTCETTNGSCYEGCQIWWTDAKCTTYIEIPDHTNESIYLLNKTEHSISIEWEHVRGISKDVYAFYGYQIEYKDDEMDTNYIQVVRVMYSSDPYCNIAKLRPNRFYSIQITPFRKYNDVKEFGTPYELFKVKTNCAEPANVTKCNVTTVPNSRGLSNISLTCEMITDIQSNCDNITDISVIYKSAMEFNFTVIHFSPGINTFIIAPNKEGLYEVQLIVMNNEGHTSSSNTYTVSVKEKYILKNTSASQMLAITAGAGSAVTMVMIIIFIMALLLWRRRRFKRASETSDHHEAFQRDTEFMKNNSNINEEKNMQLMMKSTESEQSVQKNAETKMPTTSVPESDMSEDIRKALSEEKDHLALDSPRMLADTPDTDENIYVNSAVSVIRFDSYVPGKIDEVEELCSEFKSLPQVDFSRSNVAISTDNKSKNRYCGIYAYDDTRVLLHDDEDNDYINASYITGYNMKKEYIATQGPKNTTCTDFWQMIWQEKANRIVMVANLKEKGRDKVEAYWPKGIRDSLTLGAFHITTEAINKTVDYTIRILTVRKGGECRTVHQFHFTTWQDKGKPRYGIHTLLAFINKVHSFDSFRSGPLIVHCSAGVGRTGTFIALDILQEMAIKEKTIDVYNCVHKLRHERMLMVQTRAQYVFLHEALVAFIKSHDKSVDCNEFQRRFETVCNQEPHREVMTAVCSELSVLQNLKKLDKYPKQTGLEGENQNKNRNIDVVPSDSQRLFLSRGKNGNYVNAVSVDSFKAHDSYVVTQMPLPHTISDFWQLAVEQRCQAIVMLNDISTKDQTCPRYWPEAVNMKEQYDQVEVELLSEHSEGFIVVRDLKVTELLAKTSCKPETLLIRQFQLLSWPETRDLPSNRDHILELMDKLQIWQHHNQIPADQWKPLVHCIDGVSHSGMFCGASFVLDRMKVEEDVNAFLAVQYVSRQRPQFFVKQHEYQFLYQMAMEYLRKHHEYSNLC